MAERNKKKAFWRNLKFKYRLVVTNENTLEDIVDIHISKRNGLSWLLLFLFVVLSISALILAFSPLKNYLPGYMNSEVRQQVVENALRADSLQEILDKQQLYVLNIQDILRGVIKADSVQSIDSLTTVRYDSLIEKTRREEEFQRKYEERERYNLTAVAPSKDALSTIFYRPVKGVVSAGFDRAAKHYGVDIASKQNESVVATCDGTVIFAGFTAETGYVIEIQHTQDFVSIYKYCGSVMKHEGESVKAGEVIALVGSRPHVKGGMYLHFELWYKGRAIDPAQYIAL